MASYLLDTHTAIWFFNGDVKLPESAKRLICNMENDKYVSIVSIWELAIKLSLKKITFKEGSKGFLDLIYTNGFDLLEIEPKHIFGLETLPFYHKDPFDRLLVSTALAENITIITDDENIPKYPVNYIW
jgi:PIN domain nuclease of toxin-antitoxin system